MMTEKQVLEWIINNTLDYPRDENQIPKLPVEILQEWYWQVHKTNIDSNCYAYVVLKPFNGDGFINEDTYNFHKKFYTEPEKDVGAGKWEDVINKIKRTNTL